LSLLGVPADTAGAISIELSNPRASVFNAIFSHEPGAAFATAHVYTSAGAFGSEFTLGHDLGFAAASGRVDGLLLEASSFVDFAFIGDLVTDSLVAEGAARFEADLRITGGSGPVPLEVALATRERSSTSAYAVYGESRVRIYDDGALVLSALNGPASTRLQYERTYQLSIFLNAHTSAPPGHRASNQRTLAVSLMVPEPALAGLLGAGALGLALLRATRRRLVLEVGRGRPVQHLARAMETAAVARAVPGLLGVVPGHDAAHVRTARGEEVEVAA
jgi:hypothetical protein